jgi:hypothetical protein
VGPPLAAIRSLKSLSLHDTRSKTGENVAQARLSSTRSSPGVCSPGLAWGDYGSSRPAIEGACARARFCSQSRQRQLTTSKVQRRTVASKGGGGGTGISKEVSKETSKEKLSPPSHSPRSTEAEAEAPTPSNFIVAFPIPHPPPKPAGHGPPGGGGGCGGAFQAQIRKSTPCSDNCSV